MRVALFTDTFLPKVDGIVTVICRLLEQLERRGVEVMVITPDLGPIDQYAGARVHRVWGMPFPLYPGLKLSWPLYGTWRAVKAFNPDVMHFIHSGFTGGSGMFMAMALGAPRVVSFHVDYAHLTRHFGLGFAAPVANGLTALMFNRAHHALAPSRLIAERMKQIGIRTPTTLWGRGVDAELFHPSRRSEAMRHRLTDGHPDDFLILYVGRLSGEKRLADLAPALRAVPQARLALVGDGPERPALDRAFAGLPVHFAGFMQGEELAAAFASADVFAFPSQMESFGLVAVESMAAGVPVIASRVGGIPDVVQEGVTGWTFDAGDITTLTQRVQQAYACRHELPQMGRAARAFAQTRTWPAIMDEVVALYETLKPQRGRRW
jgi:glycosyltransferase involved in cell wall biosynthesis